MNHESHIILICFCLVGEDLEVSWFLSCQATPADDTIDINVAWVRPNLLQNPWSPRRVKVSTDRCLQGQHSTSLFESFSLVCGGAFFFRCPLSCEPFLAHPLAADFYTFLYISKPREACAPNFTHTKRDGCRFLLIHHNK